MKIKSICLYSIFILASAYLFLASNLSYAQEAIIDNDCLVNPTIEYEELLDVSLKPKLRITFSIDTSNPICANIKGYKIYATYDVFDGKYDNYISYMLQKRVNGVITRTQKGCGYLSGKNSTGCKVKNLLGNEIGLRQWGTFNPEGDGYYYTNADVDFSTCTLNTETTDKKYFCYYFDDGIVGDYFVNESLATQEALIQNLEFDTTYKFKIAFVHKNGDELEEGEKILLGDDVRFRVSDEQSAISARRFESTTTHSSGNIRAREELYNTYFLSPTFKTNTKFFTLPRFWRPSTYRMSTLKLEDVLQEKWGYNIYFGEIGLSSLTIPEEFHVYKNCNLNNMDNNVNDFVYINCDRTDPVIKELQDSKAASGGYSKLIQYDIEAMLLARLRNAKIQVEVNRADSITKNNGTATQVSERQNTIFLAASNILRKHGFYKNKPYLVGTYLAKFIRFVTFAYIKQRKISDFKLQLEYLRNNFSLPDATYTNYRAFAEPVLTKLYNGVANLTDGYDENEVITLEFLETFYSGLIDLYRSLCNDEFVTLNRNEEYCSQIEENNQGVVADLINITQKLKDTFIPSYTYVKESCTSEDGCNFVNSSVTFASKELCENDVAQNSESYTCSPLKYIWDLYTRSGVDVIQNIAEQQAYHVNLMKEFIGENAKIGSVIHGAEKFSFIPSVLFDYDGQDKYGNKYKDLKTCTTDECYDKREELYTVFSQNFADEQRIFTDVFSEFLDDSIYAKPYFYYYTQNVFPSSTRKTTNSNSLYAEITRSAFDLMSYSTYFGNFERYNKDDKYVQPLSNHLKHEYYIENFDGENDYSANHFSTYQDPLYLHLLGSMYGFLKFGYMVGSVGYVQYVENSRFSGDPSLVDPEEATKDTMLISRVHAEFSYLDDFLKNSKLMLLNESEPYQANSYVITNDEKNIKAVVRKANNKEHYVLLVVSTDHAVRDNKIIFPFMGGREITVKSSPAGMLYELAYVNNNGDILSNINSDGKLVIKLLDDSKTYTLTSTGDSSLENLTHFGEFNLTSEDVLELNISCKSNFGETNNPCYQDKPICDEGLCVACDNDKVYDVESKSCVYCTASNTSKCLEGQICSNENTCVDVYECSTLNGTTTVYKNGSVHLTQDNACLASVMTTYSCSNDNTSIVVDSEMNCAYGCNLNNTACLGEECTQEDTHNCQGDTPYCDTQSNRCVECLTNNDCDASAPICNSSHVCTQCEASKVYNSQTETCVNCYINNNTVYGCNSGQTCENDTCVDVYACQKVEHSVTLTINGQDTIRTDSCINNQKTTYSCASNNKSILSNDTICEYGCSQDNINCKEYLCTSDDTSNCTPSHPYCEENTHSCKECLLDTHCTDIVNNKCNTHTYTCTECEVDSDCEAPLVCNQSTYTCVDNTKAVLLFLNCVQDNLDGSYTAYFGYENTNDTEVLVPACSNEAGQINMINNLSEDYCEQPSVFNVGRTDGAFYVVFYEGQEVSWMLQNTMLFEPSIVYASSDSTQCLPIEPFLTTIAKNEDGTFRAYFGYENRNNFDMVIPSGYSNMLSQSGTVPTLFTTGRINNAFVVNFTKSVTWTLNGKEIKATKKSAIGDKVNCEETPTDNIKATLHADEFVTYIEDEGEELLSEENPFPGIRDIEASVERRVNRANKNNDLIKQLVLGFKDTIYVCDNNDYCELVDNEARINYIERKLRKVRRQVGRTIRQRNITSRERTNLLNKNAKLLETKLKVLKKIPRFSNNCDE